MKDSLLHKHLLIDHPSKSAAYLFSPILVELLHYVAEVPRDILAQTRIYSRSAARYYPLYSAHKGGGAITFGSDTWQSITFTENFFSTDSELYQGRAYANNLDTWLSMAAHEAGHLIHAVRYKFFIFYLIIFAYQYLKYGHDAAPLEIEAEEGNQRLRKFQRYLRDQHGSFYLHDLITSKIGDEQKIQHLNSAWTNYMSSLSNMGRV